MDEVGAKKSKISTGNSKRWAIFRRLMRESRKMKFFGAAFKWKRLNLQLSFMDDFLFKIASVLEAIVLVATVCFFFLCCGCHF